MAFEDYYLLIGVPRSASSAEIRSAYRKRVLDLHPDRNPSDPEAEAKFKKVSEAYHQLSTPGLKERYDARYDSYQTSLAFQRTMSAPAKMENPSPPAPRPKRRIVDIVPQVDNPVENRDALLGILLASALTPVLTGRWSTQVLPWGESLTWTGLLFLAGLAGIVVGLVLGPLFEGKLPSSLESLDPFLPSIVAVIVLGSAIAFAPKLASVDTVRAAIPAAIVSGISSALAGALGRAFTSESQSAKGRFLGALVGGITGAVSGLLLGSFLAFAWFGIGFDTKFFDSLFLGTAIPTVASGLTAFFASYFAPRSIP